MLKKLLSAILILSIFMGTTLNVSAAESNSNTQFKPLSEITTDELTTFALNFAKDFEPTITLDINEIIPMYNNGNTLIGFSISYIFENRPYGYINLDFTKANPVTEFSICEGAESLYDSLVMDVSVERSYKVSEKKLYSIGFLQYAIPVKSNGESILHFSNGEDAKSTMRIGGEVETKYDSHSQLFSDSYASGSLLDTRAYTGKYNRGKSLISEDYIEQQTGKYACAVVALTEIANQEGILKNSSIAATFNQLWTDTGTTVSKIENGITYGSTKYINLGSAMKTYAKARGKSNTTATLKLSPDFSFFKDIVTSNISGLLTYTIELTNGKTIGHAVNMVGYCVARLNGVFSNYLIVADGWHDKIPKYINYSTADFKSFQGVKYIIK